MATVLRDKPFYDRSGGGLTLSGGEPFMQPEMATALLQASHEAGIHTAVETLSACAVEIYRPFSALYRSVSCRFKTRCRRAV